MRLRKGLYTALGCLGLALGALGAALPLLPAFPFLLLAAFSFARGSERLHRWFLHTRLYRNNLKSFLEGRGMTRGAKIRLMAAVTLALLIGFIAMGQAVWGRIALAVIWLGHLLLFLFGVRTLREPED